MKFEYPTTVSKAEYSLGQQNTVGFYPIGRLFNWHGGLHVNERGTAAVKAIANGVVIAYRLAKEPVEVNGIKFSNSFVLMRHKYTSPEGRVLGFFSLYNHLMTYDELMDYMGLPPLLMEDDYEVKEGNKDTGKIVNGLRLRINSQIAKQRKIVAVAPKGAMCDLVNTGTTPLGYVKVDYTSPNGTKYKDLLLWKSKDEATIASNKYVKIDETAGTVEVMIDEDSGKSGDVGLHLRSSASSESDNNIIKVLKVGTHLKIHPEDIGENSGFVRVIDVDGVATTGYVGCNCIKRSKRNSFKTENFDKIVTGEDCDLVATVGDIIGYTGLSGFAGQKEYRSCHVEVFTDEDPSEFLKGVKGEVDDVKNTKKYFKIAKGASLTLQYPNSFKKDDEVKVLEYLADEQELYCKISLAKQVREVNYDILKYIKGTEKKENGQVIAAQYKPAKLNDLNAIFNHTLNKDSILNWVSMLDDKDGQKRRKVAFKPNGEYIYWVKKADLGISSKPDGNYTLPQDISTLYYKKPKNDKTSSVIEHDHICTKEYLEQNIVKIANNTWYKIKCLTPIKNKHGFVQHLEIEGLIKSDDSKIIKISAFDWEAFGFKVYKDQPDTFVYHNSIKPLEQITLPEFLKSAWSLIDENSDGQISSQEMRCALKDTFAQQKLSKMVCYHQSEWGIDFGSLKSEVEILLDEGIELEEDEVEKQCLIDEKNIILSTVEKKIEAFNFWGEVNKYPEMTLKKLNSNEKLFKQAPLEFKLNNIIKPAASVFPLLKVEKLPELDLPEIPELEINWKEIPPQPKFWHFNPIAFVEQMRRMAPVFEVIFPFEIIPQNDKNNSTYKGKEWYKTTDNGVSFGASRKGGRKHAGIDLYASWGTPIRAMADGEVIDVTYWNTIKVGAIAILHKTTSGRKFVCRYCEVDYNSILVKVGDKNVKQGDVIARVGFLKYSSNSNMPPIQQPKSLRTNMLHFEFYSDGADRTVPGNVDVNVNIYTRNRSDLTNPIEILQEAYNNSFKKSQPQPPNRIDIQNLRTSEKGIEFIKLYESTKKSGSTFVKHNDSENYATIGFGHLIEKTPFKDVTYSSSTELKNGISKSEFNNGIDEVRAMELLRQDLITAENGVKKHIKVPLSQNEFDALVSLSYNCGANFLGVGGINQGDTQVKILINRGDYYIGIDEIADVTNNLTPGLVKRRQCELTIFKCNYYATKKP